MLLGFKSSSTFHSKAYIVNMSLPNVITTELLVVGAGPIGATFALLADSFGFQTTLIDAREEVTPHSEDIRNLAIVLGSWRLLESISVVDQLTTPLQHLNGLEAVDGEQKLYGKPSVRISNYDLSNRKDPLGYMVEAKQLQTALEKCLNATPSVRVIRPAKFESMSEGKNFVQASLNNNMMIQSQLVVACDGSNSKIRESTGIKTEGHDYGKSVITTNVDLDHEHNGVARQIFTREGPFATLPLQGNRANLAWYVKSETANALTHLKKPEFTAELNNRFADFAGQMKVTSNILSFPLRMKISERMIDKRVALIGEAARTINPLAGQGLNLGFKDVAALIEVLVDARRLGLDIGSLSILERFQKWRRADSTATAFSMDSIDWLFSNQLLPTKLFRGMALSTVNRSNFLKTLLARYASATQKGLPRLLLGEKLMEA